jgi:hypothetical protein
MCATGAGFPSRHAAPRQRLKHTRKDAAPRLPSRTMACVARAVPVRVLRVPPQPLQQRRRGGCAGPVRAVPSQRRGWGETDSRFSRLDKRRDGDGGDGGDGGGEAGRDSERNISFQELRKRQDREQRKVRETRASVGTASAAAAALFWLVSVHGTESNCSRASLADTRRRSFYPSSPAPPHAVRATRIGPSTLSIPYILRPTVPILHGTHPIPHTRHPTPPTPHTLTHHPHPTPRIQRRSQQRGEDGDYWGDDDNLGGWSKVMGEPGSSGKSTALKKGKVNS